MALFTQAQLQELATVFNLELPSLGILPVRDGFVSHGQMIWWRGEYGPELVPAKKDWENIKEFPQLYSHAKPEVAYLKHIYKD